MSAWEKHADVGASPHPPVGEVHVQGEIHPPPREGPKNGDIDGTENIPIVDGDYVIYNRCPVFTYPEPAGAMTHSKRHMGAKKRRVGHVPKIFGNVYKFITGGVLPLPSQNWFDMKFMGVAQDGQHNGKDAKNFPESAGRLSVMVHGAVSMIADERYLDNPSFGDYIVVVPFDSGLRINGTENYGVPIFLNVKPGTNRNTIPSEPQFEKAFKTMVENALGGDLKVDDVKASIDVFKHATPWIIGTLLEVTPGENEIRVLLRPHLPITATANAASVPRADGELEDVSYETLEIASLRGEAETLKNRIRKHAQAIAVLNEQLRRNPSEEEETKLKNDLDEEVAAINKAKKQFQIIDAQIFDKAKGTGEDSSLTVKSGFRGSICNHGRNKCTP